MKKLLILVTLVPLFAVAQEPETAGWYKRIKLKGYAHFRYNRLLENNSDFKSSSTDRSLGDKQGFFLRRARLTFYGDINDRVSFYIQPDYATEAASAQGNGDARPSQNFLQIRDAYFDYFLNAKKEFWLRPGISKVPFGFENLQSSSDRAAMDRAEAINMAAPNERDIGVFAMYTPAYLKERFEALKKMKGTGDYGMLAIGAYNGQTLNRREENNDLHRVVRVTYPFRLESGQYIEASLQAYEGQFRTDAGTNNPDTDQYEQRTAASLIFYPQPLGFRAEYNSGLGPQYDSKAGKIASRPLKGGYAQVNYQFYYQDQRFFPYVRFQEYEGGRKLEIGAPDSRLREWEVGTEWQPNEAFELTVAYMIGERMTETSSKRSYEEGQALRLQAQFNY